MWVAATDGAHGGFAIDRASQTLVPLAPGQSGRRLLSLLYYLVVVQCPLPWSNITGGSILQGSVAAGAGEPPWGSWASSGC